MGYMEVLYVEYIVFSHYITSLIYYTICIRQNSQPRSRGAILS